MLTRPHFGGRGLTPTNPTTNVHGTLTRNISYGAVVRQAAFSPVDNEAERKIVRPCS